MKQFNNALSYFTKANIIDPENTHNLNKRAIAYYILLEYDKVLSDLDKVIQSDPWNNSAYYLKSLTYYTEGDIDNATMAFEKCTKLLNPNDDILIRAKLFYLEYLLKKNSITDLDNTLTKINQISNIENSEILLFTRCSIYIELEMYYKANLDLNVLYESTSYHNYISYIYFIRKHLKFWSYIDYDKELNDLGIIDKFNKYLYTENKVYLISNLINYNYEVSYSQFQENDPTSLSGQILRSKNEGLHLRFPALSSCGNSIICKINVEKIFSKDYFIIFTHKNHPYYSKEKDIHVLRYKDVAKFEGLGWIEYKIPIKLNYWDSQLLIKTNGSIDMKIDYVRFGHNEEDIICIPNMSNLLPGFLEFFPSIPEAFKDKYFPKKEMENLVELKDILDNL